MGLDTSHDAWHGAYSAFDRWRNKIAEVAGYAVWPVQNEHGILKDTVMIDWGHIIEDNLMGKWEKPPEDPLIILIAHSDCEGEIQTEHCHALADRLVGLLPDLANEQDVGGHIGNYVDKTKTFIEGLRRAANAKETLDFH